jgi:hypothetical protein
MKELLVNHINENKTLYLLVVIKDYEIINKLGYFVINNKILYIFSLGT